MPILGIESSCDDLSMAVIDQGRILSNVTSSQIEDHAPYGGVVPEIASRRHLETLEGTLDLACDHAGISLSDLTGVAATYAPGLVGSLLVGLNFAKALAYSLRVPFRGVHHIEGHLWSPFLENDAELPFLGLVVSGGHSHLYLVKDLGKYQILGQTVDDAAGEAFDKVGKMMGLPYPGGPAIDRLSEQGNSHQYEFALPRVKGNPLNTSFSGMKTAAADGWSKESRARSGGDLKLLQADMAASFQKAVVHALFTMVKRALEVVQVKQVALAGGVACNRALRKALQGLCSDWGLPLRVPSPKYCTDNGAMIAYTGEKYLQRGEESPLILNAQARAPLGVSEHHAT